MQCVYLGGRRIIKKKFFFFKAEDGIRDPEMSRGLGDVYKRQVRLWIGGSGRWCSGRKLIYERMFG